ncbi:MAG: AAA family ATPase, partial [Candidatus Jordarchaeales archaeon]
MEFYSIQGVQARDIEDMIARITPEVLKCRSSVLHELFSEMNFILANGGFFCRVLVGDNDSGKTLISRFLLDAVNSQVLKLYVNCKMETSAYRVAVRVIRSLLPSIPGRGLSLTELVDILLEALDGRSALIVLDDSDLWLPSKNGEKLLAMLSEAESALREKQGIYLLLTLKNESPLSGLRSVNPLKCAITKL